MSEVPNSESTAPDGKKPNEPSTRVTRILKRIHRFPVVVLGLAVGVLALSAVWALEQVLQPHANHMRARAALRQVNENLRVSLDRRDDLRADLEFTAAADKDAQSKTASASPQNESKPSFPYKMTVIERDRYRRAAVAELYDIHLRMASFVRRGNELVEALDKRPGATTDEYVVLCEGVRKASVRSIACPSLTAPGSGAIRYVGYLTANTTHKLFDAAVAPGTYAQTVYHVGALGLILLGYLAVGTAILSVVGAIVGVSIDTVRDLIIRLLPSTGASIGTLLAGVVGAGAIAAGVSAATVAGIERTSLDDGSVGGREVLIDSCPRTTCCQKDPTKENAVTATNNTYTFDTRVTTEYPTSGPDAVETVERAISKLTDVVRTIGERTPVIVRVPSAPDPTLVRAIDSAAKAVSDSIGASSATADKHLAELSTRVIAVSDALDKVRQEQQDTRKAFEVETLKTTSAVNTTTERVENNTATLSPVVTHTSCQVEWQKSLQQRNGFQRLWHVFAGNRTNPCDQNNLTASQKTGGTRSSATSSTNTGDRR